MVIKFLEGFSGWLLSYDNPAVMGLDRNRHGVLEFKIFVGCVRGSRNVKKRCIGMRMYFTCGVVLGTKVYLKSTQKYLLQL